MRAVMIYIVQRMDVNSFGIAKEIDPDYFHGLTKAMQNGVEVIVLQVKVNTIGIQIINYLPILL
jgi:sugar fermentation stimulation protein A